jgi:hypothetical protein
VPWAYLGVVAALALGALAAATATATRAARQPDTALLREL